MFQQLSQLASQAVAQLNPNSPQNQLPENSFTVHEIMEIHEMQNFKTICLNRSKLVQGMVKDPDLKAMLEMDVQASIQALQDLNWILTQIVPQAQELLQSTNPLAAWAMKYPQEGRQMAQQQPPSAQESQPIKTHH
ncbi:hypothetical protein [Tumebacillus lacus]|uniref:hypothetical protein n=1 Tax=Tumebacillus lacus TaxID=2995335 RepID=UPI002B20DD79|nr:hypothetical protein [Tumebacillus lacus]